MANNSELENELTLLVRDGFEVTVADIVASDMARQTRQVVCNNICESHRWRAALDQIDLCDLVFSGELEEAGVRKFSLMSLQKACEFGQGAASVNRSCKKEPLYEYSVTILADGTSIEAWTLKEEPDLTWLSCRGKKLGCFKSTWSRSLWGRSRNQWDLFLDEGLWGVVTTGSYILFGRWFFCRHHVSWNSLEICRQSGEVLPIRLAHHDQFADYIKAVLGLALLPFNLHKARLQGTTRDSVIPEGTRDLKGKDVKILFVVNLVFRSMFFDLAYLNRTGG